jgi:hypothetical protein
MPHARLFEVSMAYRHGPAPTGTRWNILRMHWHHTASANITPTQFEARFPTMLNTIFTWADSQQSPLHFMASLIMQARGGQNTTFGWSTINPPWNHPNLTQLQRVHGANNVALPSFNGTQQLTPPTVSVLIDKINRDGVSYPVGSPPILRKRRQIGRAYVAQPNGILFNVHGQFTPLNTLETFISQANQGNVRIPGEASGEAWELAIPAKPGAVLPPGGLDPSINALGIDLRVATQRRRDGRRGQFSPPVS